MEHKMKWLLFGGAVLLVLGLFVLGSRMMPTLKNQSAINQIKEAAVSQAESVKQKKADLKNANLKHIYLAGGCFWGVEEYFSRVDGVVDAVSGYANGTSETTKYELISTDPELTMKTSADMMKEKWYQDAIHKGVMPILTPARRTVSHTTDEKWVISIMQEVVDKDGKNLGVVRLDIGYKTLEAYLDQLQLGKEGFTFIVDSNHDFVYHPKKTVYSSATEMRAMAPYIAAKNGYVKSKQAYVSQYQIPHSD